LIESLGGFQRLTHPDRDEHGILGSQATGDFYGMGNRVEKTLTTRYLMIYRPEFLRKREVRFFRN
jgi:hypothetical protein